MVPVDARKPKGRMVLYAALGMAFVISMVIAWNSYAIRSNARWFIRARRYKAEVLAQPIVNRQLRRIEWDGWGGAPIGDWTVYLVFDPTDSLSAAASRRGFGKLSGIPCDVDEVRRLESHWYSVTLSMNEWWDQCK
jgi:hypothetical protein